ncbi:Rpn family recombination-promoting nuclease/putative transposase [Clostridium botulinum]|uniref:Rpn family recombination-promoting nuclease/putative transposase n=1 Tax=Clostridium botulinum TaxID=1491 RepID=UPI000774B21C|nr:Rpn family recombination-promoting nuclease/putative transposase [Clostridium botulinum]NFE94666.1 Rpn family recombination-promoting nuclease/putative transposase [Clostridium botulinum]NFL36669.1 Rpn family recombination-promoting nuclease/putative transposase [Clostridium botulinum]NFL65548.1 Rpn family recombination-promoting nuclease/putative transposase [Clostridium botulinum]NFN06777.1 Rpn family recombination-promoting nuclease/putative transposase [Clostridium botulinum]NFN26425.1 
MLKGLLDPKIDFIFKNIFGAEKNSRILISFLNSVLKSSDPIKSVEIKNTDIEKAFVEDKFSRLDVKATTSNNEIVNIEIQLKNEYNMVKRSLYYWSKLYEEQLGEGEDYSKLKRTICINILNFKYLKNNRFHNAYRLKEVETNEQLTDVQEIHFIEIPKLDEKSDERDLLVAWTEFLKDPESEKVRSLEMTVEEIREAKDELIKISNDEKQRELYEMRAKILKDKVSALNEAERKGLEKGAILSRREDILENLGEIAPVTKEIVKRVNDENDIGVLKKWLKISVRVDTLEEFIKRI